MAKARAGFLGKGFRPADPSVRTGVAKGLVHIMVLWTSTPSQNRANAHVPGGERLMIFRRGRSTRTLTVAAADMRRARLAAGLTGWRYRASYCVGSALLPLGAVPASSRGVR